MTTTVDNLPEIPRPEVLDAHRTLGDTREDFTLEDHRSRAQLLASALDEACGYASALWDTSARMRTYLHEHTPDDPADDAAWSAWQDAYAATVSILCGPRGDSGFGASQAQLVAQTRRAR